MAIFGKLIVEPIVQINDKTRLDGSKSFISTGEAAITLVRIKPEVAGTFIDVGLSNLFLDWSFITAGTKTVTIEITTNGAAEEFTDTIEVLSVADDNLWSTDSDLLIHEDNIIDYSIAGRNSMLNYHRRAQTLILDHMDEAGYTDDNNDRLTKAAVINTTEVNRWSTYMTLRLIFDDLSNNPDDVFDKKARDFEARESNASAKAMFRLDLDGDGTQEDGEQIDVRSIVLRRT